MMKILSLLLTSCIAFLIHTNICIAQLPKSAQNLLQNKEWGFVPNKGQLADEHSNALNDVKYYAHEGAVQLYCRAHKISFVFSTIAHDESNVSEYTGANIPKALRPDTHQNDRIYYSRADMMLMGANPNAKIIATDEMTAYQNYYLAQATVKEIGNIHACKTLTYQNIYPHIDLVLHSRMQGIKYEYVVYPGGRVSDIKMQWYGPMGMQLSASGGIRYSMRLAGKKTGMEESAPSSFTANGKVASSFVKHGNSISFKVAQYDHHEILTIDPELNWATYFGGIATDFGNKVHADASGSIIVYGYTASTTNIASSGAYQSAIAGGYDLYIAKFNSYGGQLWSTYYGTSGSDQAQGMALDASGNIYVTGYTSSNGLATSGAYKSSIAGGNDGFLIKFNNSGTRLWGTYIGGGNEDFAEGVALDASGNIFVCGRTQSTGMATSGAYLSSFNSSIGYNVSAYIIKFSNAGSLSWATYFGADNSTYPGSMDVDKSGNLFITGYTGYTKLATKGAFQTSHAVDYDAFLAKFSSSGSLYWCTLFSGSAGAYGFGVVCDASDNVLISGYTRSDASLATAGAYQTSFGGQTDIYLAKFSNSGALAWATYYGGAGYDYFYGMCVDADESIYLTGGTGSSDGIATDGAYQSTLAGSIDVFVAKFSKAGKIVWGTYYGGSSVEYGYGMCVDASKNVYVTGYTFSASGIASTNAFQPTQISSTAGFSDAFILRFSDPYPNNAGLNAIKSPHGKTCMGYTATKVSLQNDGTKPLKSLTIGWAVDGIAQKDYNWTGNLAPGDTVSVSLSNPYNYALGAHSIKVYSSQPNGVKDSMPNNDTIKATFTTHPLTDASWAIQYPSKGPNYHFKVKDSSLAKNYYTWILGDGFHYNGYSFTHAFPSPGTYDVKLITFNTFGCLNEHDTSMLVSTAGIAAVYQNDAFNINILPNPFRDKTIIHFDNPQAAMVKIRVSDILGRELYSSQPQYHQSGNNETTINASEAMMAAGTYFVSIIIGDAVAVRKILVMK